MKNKNIRYVAHATDIDLHQTEYVVSWLKRQGFKTWKIGSYMNSDRELGVMIYVERKEDITAAVLREPIDSFQKSPDACNSIKFTGNVKLAADTTYFEYTE